MRVLGWREVPTDNSTLGVTVKPTEPKHMQVFIARAPHSADDDEFERRLYILRKTISGILYQRRQRAASGYYPCSISCRTVIYKGMFLADQLGTYYPDLHAPDFESALALVHQRFSTNTFPTWSLAHPYRMVAHNGEINTLRGNNNWMAARQASVSSPKFGLDINRLWPISYEGQSDTACFDNGLEFLVQGGYSLAHAVMMMIPEAWAGNPLMDEERRAFYEYNAALMEPWDGPAAIAFTDGRQIGATLDRNGLRPARYFVTRDGRVIMASEMGVLPIADNDVVTKWRLQPGKMLLIDLVEGRLIPDEEIKAKLARSHPYKKWLDRTQIQVEDLPPAPSRPSLSNLSLLDRQQAFGYTQEDLKLLMTPMATTGEEAVGSMGNDTPISALSDKPKPLFTYFKQNFAQVTNPPISNTPTRPPPQKKKKNEKNKKKKKKKKNTKKKNVAKWARRRLLLASATSRSSRTSRVAFGEGLTVLTGDGRRQVARRGRRDAARRRAGGSGAREGGSRAARRRGRVRLRRRRGEALSGRGGSPRGRRRGPVRSRRAPRGRLGRQGPAPRGTALRRP